MNLGLTVTIHKFVEDVDSLFSEFAAKHNLNVNDMLILHQLYRQNAQSASDLARSIGRKPTSFTPALDRIEKVGLICRRPDPHDRRTLQIVLTPEGEALRKDIVGHMDVTEKRIRSVLMNRIKQPISIIGLETLFAPLPE